MDAANWELREAEQAKHEEELKAIIQLASECKDATSRYIMRFDAYRDYFDFKYQCRMEKEKAINMKPEDRFPDPMKPEKVLRMVEQLGDTWFGTHQHVAYQQYLHGNFSEAARAMIEHDDEQDTIRREWEERNEQLREEAEASQLLHDATREFTTNTQDDTGKEN